ncbi:MAG: hypothetical protein ACOY46_00620 [Bacillota bacterium]
MHCQLDQVREILDVATATGNAILKETPEAELFDFSRMSCSVIYGLLLLKDYDVFIQEGLVDYQGREMDHFWVEVYFEGEAFILDTAIARFLSSDGRVEDVIFLPGDEASGKYGYRQGKDYEWSPEDCDERVWQSVIKTLGIEKPLSEILADIREYSG